MAEPEQKASARADYDLIRPIDTEHGLRQGLTSYGDAHFSLFLRKVIIKAACYSDDAPSRPVLGIINTHSGFNPCHSQVPQLIEAAKRGVMLSSGGLPIDFPTISLHESFSSLTSMYLRNLMSMDTEEMIKAQPLDACIMIGGCKPSGDNYMNDFHNAGGMVALLDTLRPLLYLDAKTVTGKTLGEELDTFKSFPYS
jgi:dihydroxy-acid dehydratase